MFVHLCIPKRISLGLQNVQRKFVFVKSRPPRCDPACCIQEISVGQLVFDEHQSCALPRHLLFLVLVVASPVIRILAATILLPAAIQRSARFLSHTCISTILLIPVPKNIDMTPLSLS
jgi:hypothetical protein